MADVEKIGGILKKAGFEIDRTTAEKFDIYLKFLVEYNLLSNITSIDEEDAPAKHFADSLPGAEFILPGAKVVDVGSGGGFPGVPLKLLRDDIELTCIDANAKKCAFLRALSPKLGVKFDVKHIRAEEAGEYREVFDAAVTRAVSELNVLSELCLPLVSVGGRLIAYKGKLSEEELRSGVRAAEKLGARLYTVSRYGLFGAERAIVVFEKVSPVPPGFPRRFKKIVSDPI